MDELSQKVEGARRHLADIEWDPNHSALVLVQMHRRGRRRSIARATGIAGLASAALVLGFLLAPTGSEQAASQMRLADGTILEPARGAEVGVEEISERSVAVKLVRGFTHFDVAKRPERTFVVRSGDVKVVVLGTAFSVDRANDRTIVAVERGRVRVEWPNGAAELGAGESGTFPPDETERPLTALVDPEIVEAAPIRAEPVEPPISKQMRQSIAEAQPRVVDRETPVVSDDTPPIPPDPVQAAIPTLDSRLSTLDSKTDSKDELAELLEAADVARLAGHAEEALPFLRRIIDNHPRDPRASLSAFTLGRILLDLDRPVESADAFARARRIDPSSSLAEDALAREVEAWSKAGDEARAAARAAEYRSLYPEGRRVKIVE